MVMPWTAPKIAGEHLRWASEFMGSEAYPAWQQNQAMGQLFISWLYNYFYSLQFATDAQGRSLSMGDPDNPKSNAYKQLEQLANQVDAGADVTTLPYFDQFWEVYQNVYPPEAVMAPEESEYMGAQTDLLRAQIQQILNNIAQSGQMTEYERGYLDYLMQQLEYQMQQAGVGEEQEWARIDLERQQLAAGYEAERMQGQLAYNQWLAGLRAQPATMFERWYAEKLPWGGERIPLESDIYTRGGQYPEWAQWLTQPNPFAPTPTPAPNVP